MPPRRSGGWVGWLFFVLLLGGAGAFVWYLYLPLRKSALELNQRGVQAAETAKRQDARLKDSESRLAEITAKQEALTGQLVQTVAEKEKIEAELKSVQDSLAQKLEPEIQAGNVRIVRRGNDLVVDLADQILFESGKSEVHEKGQKVLSQVAPTLAQLTDYSIQVGGHTDSSRITASTTQERFPTNWELSAARATNVVRFLEERGNVPGSRLAAMGLSMYRPVASNSTTAGRQKNRRIELVLIHVKPAGAAPVATSGN
jgi:chemotaxis protein MotB